MPYTWNQPTFRRIQPETIDPEGDEVIPVRRQHAFHVVCVRSETEKVQF